MSLRPVGDGSSIADREPTVVIDPDDESQRWRYRCPNGHTDWDRTNNHVWCRSCRHQAENGDDLDPEHWFIVDSKTDEEIPWSAVEVRDR